MLTTLLNICSDICSYHYILVYRVVILFFLKFSKFFKFSILIPSYLDYYLMLSLFFYMPFHYYIFLKFYYIALYMFYIEPFYRLQYFDVTLIIYNALLSSIYLVLSSSLSLSSNVTSTISYLQNLRLFLRRTRGILFKCLVFFKSFIFFFLMF